MIGIQFDSGDTAEAVQWAAFQRGLLVLEAGDDVVRISPPLTVAEDEIEVGVRLLRDAVAGVEGGVDAILHQARSAGAVNEVDAGG